MQFHQSVTVKFNVQCPHCKQKFSFASGSASDGASGTCPHCATTFTIADNPALEEVNRRLAAFEAGFGASESSATNAERAITPDTQSLPLPETNWLAANGNAKSLAKLINALSVAAALWLLLYPRPYPLAVLASALVPATALALVLLSKGTIRLVDSRKTDYPQVAYCFGPMAVLAFTAVLYDVDNYSAVLGPLLLSVLIVMLVLARFAVGIKDGKWNLLIILPYIFAYCFGVIVHANCLLDRSMPTPYAASIVDKHHSSGGYRQVATYYLTVTPWGNKAANNDISVSHHLYDRAGNSDQLRILYRQGLFSIPWYSVSLRHAS
jgi:hypothetical protein